MFKHCWKIGARIAIQVRADIRLLIEKDKSSGNRVGVVDNIGCHYLPGTFRESLLNLAARARIGY